MRLLAFPLHLRFPVNYLLLPPVTSFRCLTPLIYITSHALSEPLSTLLYARFASTSPYAASSPPESTTNGGTKGGECKRDNETDRVGAYDTQICE